MRVLPPSTVGSNQRQNGTNNVAPSAVEVVKATTTAAASSSSSTIPPTVKNKVPKMVKSLQSGCFMSSDHVMNVLKDCLALIHDNSDLQWDLGQSEEGVPALVKIMNRFEDTASVQELTCAILRDLCSKHEDNRLWVASEGGLQALLVALLKHEHAMSVQVTALHALANISMNEQTKLLVPEMNGLEVLKTCMEAYVDNMAVQIQACRVISALAQVPANARALAALGLSQSVVQTMQQSHFKRQEEEQKKQEQQEQKPNNNSQEDKNDSNAKIKTNAKNGNGKSAAAAATENYTGSTAKCDDETLQYHACAAVWALTFENELIRGQMSTVIPFVLVAMKTYESNAALQAIACGALWNLTTNHVDNAHEIVSYDYEQGIKIILNALKLHPTDPNVQEAACAVIKNLSMTVEEANVVGHTGAIAPILNAMRQHENSQAVQAEGCSALCNLAMVEDHKAPILNAGGIGMIVFAMRQALQDDSQHPSSQRSREEVQKHACKALTSLAVDSEQNKVSIAASGGIATILLAMERYPDNGALQVLALNALRALTDIHRNRTIILNHRGIAIIEAALNNHPFDAYLEKRVLELLEHLSVT
ncbi:hypothetical protein ACA910_004973 [Epithemia clementina (nom. ined.)]